MNAARLKQIEEIYHAAAESSPAERSSLVRVRCDGDDTLRREVESLLAYDEVLDSFIDSSPEAITAEMLANEEPNELIGSTLGHYRIERVLGVGGMGKVYLADDTLLDRKVALKLLPPNLLEHHDRLIRFKQEAKAASALNHPNILTIHEFGTDQDSHYIVTEFVDGVTLRQKVRDRLSIEETLEIANQAASALAAAHAAGIVHRDVKPDNMMIRRDGILKVLDFGLAKLVMPSPPGTASDPDAQTLFRTEPGMVMGTAAYLSPEQARGLPVDGRTDIWSLGVTIYEMATGNLPFEGATHTDVLVAILNQPVPMIENFIDDAPAELKRIIDKALAKNIGERYQTIEDLAFDLKRLRSRLEFLNELKRDKADPHRTDDERDRSRETSTRMMPIAAPVAASEQQRDEVSEEDGVANKTSRAYLPLLAAAVVVLTGLIASAIWQFGNPAAPAQQQTIASIPQPPSEPVVGLSRKLTYSLTVQSFTDGRYKKPFPLTGEMLFRNRDRIRINIKSPQSGHLYILNQGPGSQTGAAVFNTLFPTPRTNGGNAQLSAGQQIQIPQQSWFELDKKEGVELVWLIWSANLLPELESAKRFANPTDRGRISDRQLTQSIESLIQQHRTTKIAVERDDEKKESQITGNADIVVHLIRLEHH